VQMSPYWRAVWAVAQFLLALSLLLYVTGLIFSLLAFKSVLLVSMLLQPLVALVGALVYLDWQWGWRADTVGLTGGRHMRWLPAGLGAGLLALLTTHGLGILFGGAPVPVLQFDPLNLMGAMPGLINILAAELIFRGAATAQLQAELAPKEALWTALALPLVTDWLGSGLPTGIHGGQPWTLFLMVALTLLYVRTGALWLNLGLSAVVVLVPQVIGLSVVPQAALLLWATVALILLLMAWQRADRAPRRVGPQRRRGPWR
jgi:hypothetical protein